MIIKYCCEKCGKEFDTSEECLKHENQCKYHMSEEKIAILDKVGLDKMCDNCANAYYVYGCEQDCKYSRTCHRRDKYPFWIPKKD